MRSTRLIMLAAAAASAAGCGGAGSAGDGDVERPVRAYYAALAGGDGARACGQLTPELKRRALLNTQDNLPELRATSCEQAVGGLSRMLSRDALRGADIVRTTINGDFATVILRGASVPVELTRTGGRWLISAGLF